MKARPFAPSDLAISSRAPISPCGDRRSEDFEAGGFEGVRKINQLETEARVGFVDAITVHRILVGETREWRGEVLIKDVLPDFLEHAFEERVDAFAVDEGNLDVDLGELHLAIGAEIFVAEAAGDLEIFFDAGDHEDLLELLGRLGERVKLAGVNAGRHEVFAGTFGCALEERGRLDLVETLGVEVIAHGLGGAMAHLEILAHLRPAQVEVAVGQAKVLVDLVAAGIVERERRRVGNIMDLEGGGIDFDLTSRDVFIHHRGGAELDFAGDADDRLGLEQGGLGAAIGVELDLRDAFAIAEVDKDNAAVVAHGVHPASEGDGCVKIGGGELGAMMGAFHRDRGAN